MYSEMIDVRIPRKSCSKTRTKQALVPPFTLSNSTERESTKQKAKEPVSKTWRLGTRWKRRKETAAVSIMESEVAKTLTIVSECFMIQDTSRPEKERLAATAQVLML